MSGVSAIIFDFNGVLVDDESVHCALFQEVLAHEGVIITERDYHERYLGYDDRKCFEVALEDGGQKWDRTRIDAMIARKARRYVEVAGAGLRFFPGAAEVLSAISDRWPVAICSGALRPEIEFALVLIERADRIAAIVSAEDTERCKPDPEGYQLALAALRAHLRERLDDAQSAEELDLAAERCIVIEDSLAGIIAAKGAGMRAIGVTNTYPAEQLRQAGADLVINHLATLTPEWIDQQFAS